MGILRYGKIAALCTLALSLSACGGGGSGGTSNAGGGSASLLADLLAVLSHEPAADSVQAPVDAQITVDFDARIATECLQHEDTWLRITGSQVDLAVTFTTANSGHSVVMTPSVPLLEETDYTVQLSALTCDMDGRLLEEDFSFSFRSFDAAAPRVINTSVTDGATGVANTSSFTIDFDESLDAASITVNTVRMRDLFGTSIAVDASLSGSQLTIDPIANLAGDRSYLLEVKGGRLGITDRAGNSLASSLVLSIRTATDSVAPKVLSSWPMASNPLSPALQPSFTFSESMDPNSVENASLSFTDQFANIVSYQIVASTDQKTLRVVPDDDLIPGRSYSIRLATGPGAVTDLSGNPLAFTALISLNIGTDFQAPRLVSSSPAEAATLISPNARPLLHFSEALDPATVDSARVFLSGPGGATTTTLTLLNGDQDLRLTAPSNLAVSSEYQLTIKGGQDGIRDLAGNPLAADQSLRFTVSDDPSIPTVQIWPRHGETQTPPGAHISVLSDIAIDPATFNANSVTIEGSINGSVAGTLSLLRSNRLIRFVPDSSWTTGQTYTITVSGEAQGLRVSSGNWLAEDVVSTFQARTTNDQIGPTVSVTVNSLADQRKQERTLPGSGFEINVSAFDQFGFSLDMASTLVEITGPAEAPDTEAIFATATIDGSTLRWRVPTDLALPAGNYNLRAKVSDLSGNLGISGPLSFQVKGAGADVLPFERTHVVWVRFDLDRDSNGTPDFEDDLLRLGLITAGDPAGTNQRMTEVMRNAILAQCNHLYGRKINGGRLGADSVAIRFSHLEPIGVVHMQIACGGLDPEGTPNRVYGDRSNGILGRAFYDYRNAITNDMNIGKSPGVGVFPGELFLFEARIHQQVFPSFLTSFANRFLSISPAMGGTSAGIHAEDATVIDKDFDFSSGTTLQKARFNAIFLAADDWALAIGTILAHEVGHSVGLVASGTNALALHGDLSLHNEFSSSVDVMAAAVGYDALINLDYRMRDLNIAYLRQRVLLK